MDKGCSVVLEWIKNGVSIFSTFVGIVGSFLFWAISPSYLLPSWIFILLIIVTLFVIWILSVRIITMQAPITRFTSTIISFDESNNRLLFRVNIQSVITIGSYVMLYRVANGFEERVAIVKINNIQDSGVIQAELVVPKEQLNIANEVLIVKPTLTVDAIKVLFEENQ